MQNKITFLVILLLSFSLTSCDNNGDKKQTQDTTQASSESITVSNAYVRAMPPGQQITAAFLELKNTADKKAALVSAESDISEFVELHAHTLSDGMMSMGQVDKIVIPKNSSVALATGGYHIMMINLKKDLVVGQTVDIKLKFEDGSSLIIRPEVMKK